MNESLYKKLERYSEDGRIPFHMPGHKRKGFDNCLPLSFSASIDITEIDGFDDLHHPEGIILEIEKKAERLYNSKKCFLSTNGSTGGILAAVRTAYLMGKRQGKNTIALARNCHKSVYNAVELCGANPVYLMPPVLENIGAYSSVCPRDVEKLFEGNGDVSALVITSPTYEGIVSDISKIAEIVHKHDAMLIVDEAHGAHLPFFTEGAVLDAIGLGGDIVIHSLHKSLSALNQASSVHVGKDSKTDISLLARQMTIFNTSSPSYPTMASIEYAIDHIAKDGLDDWFNNVKNAHERLKSLKNLKIFGIEDDTSVFATDISKIVISTVGTSIDGYTLADTLRNDFNIECESANMNYVIAMTGQGTTEFHLQALTSALMKIDGIINKKSEKYIKTFPTTIPKLRMNSNSATAYPTKSCDYKEGEGEIAGQYLWLYPPGIPIIVPGEVIGKETVDIIDIYKDHIVSNNSSEDFDGVLTIIESC